MADADLSLHDTVNIPSSLFNNTILLPASRLANVMRSYSNVYSRDYETRAQNEDAFSTDENVIVFWFAE